MAFLALSLIQLVHMFNSKLSTTIFCKHKVNKMVYLSLGICLAMLFAVALIPPFMTAFEVVSLSLTQWLIVVGLSLCIIPAVEIYKAVFSIIKKKKEAK
jgi:magnesium-transporting ATPase (P-type)